MRPMIHMDARHFILLHFMVSKFISHFRRNFSKYILLFHSLGSENVTKLLIDNGADVNAKDMFKTTPLHLAAENCNFFLNTSKMLNIFHLSFNNLFPLLDSCS